MILNEGGNIWPESSEYEQTSEMINGLVQATEGYLQGTGLKLHVIGSSATPTQNVYAEGELIGIYRDGEDKFTPTKTHAHKYPEGPLPQGAQLTPKKSGDLDVMADLDQAAKFFQTKDGKTTRQALDDYLKSQGLKVHKAGVTVHTLVPFNDAFYQVDIKIVAKAEKVSKFHHHNIPAGSPYKGVNKQMMLNTLASSNGLLWSPDEGLYKRDAAGKKADFLSDDMDEIAQYLLGPSANANSLGSVESILDAIPDEATRTAILDKAKASASWQAATPHVGTNEWFSRMKRMLS